jgi:hypothetical protein
MQAHDMSDYHRRQLLEQNARARAELEAATRRAREEGAARPKTDPGDLEIRLWNAAGYWAMLFCIWFAFIAPIVLVLTLWDEI